MEDTPVNFQWCQSAGNVYSLLQSPGRNNQGFPGIPGGEPEGRILKSEPDTRDFTFAEVVLHGPEVRLAVRYPKEGEDGVVGFAGPYRL
jgi:hypothetical protein